VRLPENSLICRQDANFGTPHVIERVRKHGDLHSDARKVKQLLGPALASIDGPSADTPGTRGEST
jgi:hypothetical protein